MLHPPEALLLDGTCQLAVAEHHGGYVPVVCVDP
jgi:hypothetical protein